MAAARVDATTYRWSRAYGVRLLGLALAVLGATFLVMTLADRAGWTVVLVGLVAVVAAVVLARLVVWPPAVLVLTADGYRVRHLRGAGARAASWREVEGVQTRTTSDGPAIVVELADGRTSVVPLALLGPRAGEAQREIHERLNTAFGYRRL
jgi:hypothetical protein